MKTKKIHYFVLFYFLILWISINSFAQNQIVSSDSKVIKKQKTKSTHQKQPQTSITKKTQKKNLTQHPSKSSKKKKKAKNHKKKTSSLIEKDPILEDLTLTNQGFSKEESLTPPSKNKVPKPLLSKEKSTSSTSPKQPVINQEPSLKQIEDPSELKFLLETYRSQKNTSMQLKILHILSQRFSDADDYRWQYIQLKKKTQYELLPTREKKDELFQDFQKLIEDFPKKPKYYWALFELVDQHIQMFSHTPIHEPEMISQALNILKDIVLRFGESTQTAQNLCYYLTLNYFQKEALFQCEKTKKLKPNHPQAYLLVYQLSNQKKKELMKILKKFPHSPEVLHFIGKTFFKEKNNQLAYRYFKKTHQIEPKYFPAILSLAESLFEMDQFDQSLSYYKKACRKNPLKTKLSFQKSKSRLSQKGQFSKSNQYQKYINQCVSNVFKKPNHM